MLLHADGLAAATAISGKTFSDRVTEGRDEKTTAKPELWSDFTRFTDAMHRTETDTAALKAAVLLTALLSQGLLGLFSNDDILFDGPLSHLVGKASSDLVTHFHKLLFFWLVGMVLVHILAVLAHRLITGEDIVHPMITGVKTIAAASVAELRFVSPIWAAFALAATAILVWSPVSLP